MYQPNSENHKSIHEEPSRRAGVVRLKGFGCVKTSANWGVGEFWKSAPLGSTSGRCLLPELFTPQALPYTKVPRTFKGGNPSPQGTLLNNSSSWHKTSCKASRRETHGWPTQRLGINTLKWTLGWKILVMKRTWGGTNGYCSGTLMASWKTPSWYGVSVGPCLPYSINTTAS